MGTSFDSPASSGRKELTGEVIVLLEDDELVRRATERLLRRLGAEVVAGAGSSAVVGQLAGLPAPPTCVIADYWLNREEDGIGAILAIRNAVGSSVKGLILTGDSTEEINSKIAAAGFQLLRKPVDVEAFLRAIVLES